ncbi:hypothetical protein P872_15260 [Rhodonellum psychrophilum GCM71 = DSM 17998]|uniref:Uncharacterized protein n=1 Tax=Rhodonellum psychrophilum GCM71 = DSM 17998 TaxID=1123057 RepID=U5BU31_9BACT|nr:hypothetical protein P872_15260 [Rhodonellum psychrophilum GCM71 = DSM 17998]
MIFPMVQINGTQNNDNWIKIRIFIQFRSFNFSKRRELKNRRILVKPVILHKIYCSIKSRIP